MPTQLINNCSRCQRSAQESEISSDRSMGCVNLCGPQCGRVWAAAALFFFVVPLSNIYTYVRYVVGSCLCAHMFVLCTQEARGVELLYCDEINESDLGARWKWQNAVFHTRRRLFFLCVLCVVFDERLFFALLPHCVLFHCWLSCA